VAGPTEIHSRFLKIADAEGFDVGSRVAGVEKVFQVESVGSVESLDGSTVSFSDAEARSLKR